MTTPDDERSGGLLAWQWRLYAAGHRSRANLWIHVFTVPLFWFGTLALFVGTWRTPWSALVGVVSMAGAMAAQGRGHAGERVAPVPFRGPLDVVARIFLEQWVTFPRYLISGELFRALRLRP